MPTSLTDTLCTRCGLCCDGSLFADVELAGEKEAVGLEILSLDVEEDGDGFVLLQPCAALEGRRCSVYRHRPECCRTFECRLLQDARSGAVSIEEALARVREAHASIRRVKVLLGPRPSSLGRVPLKERCEEVIAAGSSAAPRVAARKARLRAAMNAVQRIIGTTFLGDGKEIRSGHVASTRRSGRTVHRQVRRSSPLPLHRSGSSR